jgi:hypothetical protein
MYVLEDSSYPLILGYEFLDKHQAILRFHAGRRDLELPILSSEVKQLLNPVLSLIEPLQIPPFSRCFAECSVSIAPDLPGTYFFEPNSELFGLKGALVSRGIVAVGTTPLIVLIANISDSEVITLT